MRYSESKKSTSENSVTQKEAKLSKKRIELVMNVDNTTEQSMAKDIEIIDNENALSMKMRLEYFELRLHDQMKISEADKLLKVVDQIEERSAKILLNTKCS